MPPTPNLKELQSSFGAFLYNGDPDASAFEKINQHFVSLPHRQSNGLAIYYTGLRNSLTQSLESTYPVLRLALEKESFHYLAQAFIYQNPAKETDISLYGKEFPDFLASYPELQSAAFWADLGRLEWAWHWAFFAPSSKPIVPEQLQALAEGSEDFKLSLIPSATLVYSAYPIRPFWEQADSKQALSPPSVQNKSESFLVYREGLERKMAQIQPELRPALNGLAQTKEIEQWGLDLSALQASLSFLLQQGWLQLEPKT